MSVVGRNGGNTSTWQEPSVNVDYDDGWGGAPIITYEDEVKPVNPKRPGQPDFCPEHGAAICPKGICKYQAKLKRDAERKKEDAERKKERDERIRKAKEKRMGPNKGKHI
jgi:hypothetical protein